MPYFDWNATAPMLPQAREVWLKATEREWGNPSTAYRLGARTRVALEEARERLSAMLGCHPEQVIFTSGATEGNNGFLREAARRASPDATVWISALEHPSVVEAARYFWGPECVVTIPVTPDGEVDLEWITDRMKSESPALVSVMAANNETGVLQPWEAVLRLCQSRGIPFHCDAVQWVGKAPVSDWSGCAGLTLSGHKFGGPKGVGCLMLGDEFKGTRIQCGGAQELDARAGTENVPSILAMVAALEERVKSGLSPEQKQARDVFEKDLGARWPGETVFHGAGAKRLWNTSSVTLPEFRSARWIAQLDRLDFQVSSGSACSTGKSSPSAVLHAMGVGDEAIRRTVRISSGWETSAADWTALLEALTGTRQRLSSEPPAAGPGKVIEI